MLYWLQHTGHRPIALMGGGTTKVGDPTGKDEHSESSSPTRTSRRTPPASNLLRGS
ncbi:MAG: hypothetical protein R3C58_06810 [Parvularculaceae bacterium]